MDLCVGDLAGVAVDGVAEEDGVEAVEEDAAEAVHDGEGEEEADEGDGEDGPAGAGAAVPGEPGDGGADACPAEGEDEGEHGDDHAGQPPDGEGVEGVALEELDGRPAGLDEALTGDGRHERGELGQVPAGEAAGRVRVRVRVRAGRAGTRAVGGRLTR